MEEIRCNHCGGDNISQAASVMISVKEANTNTYEFKWEDLMWEDYYFCHDCEEEVVRDWM